MALATPGRAGRSYSKEREEMTKAEALKLIDDHKNELVDPVKTLHWTWLRVTILQIPDDEWNAYLTKAAEVLSR